MRATPSPITHHLTWLAVVAFVLFASPGQRCLVPAQSGVEVSLMNVKAAAGALKALVSAAGGQRILGVVEDCGSTPGLAGDDSPAVVSAAFSLHVGLQPGSALPLRCCGPLIVRTIELRI